MSKQSNIINKGCQRRKKVASNGQFLEIEDGITLKLCKSIIEIADQWFELVPQDMVFFSIPYLGLLEDYPFSHTQMRYALLFKDGQPFGAMVCQERHFILIDSLKENDPGNNILKKLSNYIRTRIAKRVKFKALLCGNLSLTGENGFYFKDKNLSHKQKFELVEKALDTIREYIKITEGVDIPVSFIKDFYEEHNFSNSEITKSSFAEFSVQPNMIFCLNPEWKKFDDYLEAMTSKYRVRARRAFKKAEPIERKLLSWYEIQRYEGRMYQLYQEITDKAGFNIIKLHPKYFTYLKKELPRKVKIYGYFHEDSLVAFNSVIWNGDELEAHFLGYDQELNRKYQLYLNMLYDIIDEGIQSRVKLINFARTALEIKSSVGAIPKEMFLYLKHRNNFNNKFVPHLLKYLSPVEDWIPRNPFKEQGEKTLTEKEEA